MNIYRVEMSLYISNYCNFSHSCLKKKNLVSILIKYCLRTSLWSLIIIKNHFWERRGSLKVITIDYMVGEGDKWPLMKLSFTHVTTQTKAHSRRFGFFRNFFGSRSPISPDLTWPYPIFVKSCPIVSLCFYGQNRSKF